MCGRTTSELTRDELARLLDVEEVDAPDLPLSWNVAPARPVYTVVSATAGARRLTWARWGLVLPWSGGPASRPPIINARAETLTRKPAFRGLCRTGRVLLPVSGFYEWQRQPGPRRAGSRPFYFKRADGAPLALAGVVATWHDAEGRPLRTCAIVTTAANATMAPVHDRMPAFLEAADWDEWLAPQAMDDARLAQLLAPPAPELLCATEVASTVNNPRNDGPQLVHAAPAGPATPTGPDQLSLLPEEEEA